MPTLREFSKTPGITKNPALLKFLYWNQVVKDSPKYKTMAPEAKSKVFSELVRKPGPTVLKAMGKAAYEKFTKLPGIRHGDIAVEEVAKFVEPEVPAGRTTLGLLTKDLPRQVAADVLRAYKPSRILPFIAAFKIAKPAVTALGGPVARAVARKIPAPIKRTLLKQFTIGKGQPRAFRELRRVAQLEKAAGVREAEAVAKTLTTAPAGGLRIAGRKGVQVIKPGKPIPLEQQQFIGRIFRKEVIESPALKAHPKFQQLKSISNEGRIVMDKWSTALAKSGIPKEQSKQVIEANVGQYMARMFKSKLEKTGTGFGFKDLRLRLNGLKHRKDLSDAVLRRLGEIKEPALPTAIRVKEISTSIANNRLFNTVAKNPEWVANTNTTGTLVKMADTPALGALRNKWVVREIADEVNAITQAAGMAQNWYAKGMGAWKYGKVVLNPATHARNMMSNSMLLDLSGTNHIRQARLYPKAFKEYLGKGRIYQQALKEGAIGGEFVGGDVAKIRDSYMAVQGGNLKKWMNVLKTPFKKAGDVYQGEEQLAKLVKYMDVIERGGTSTFAASEAQKWLFDYREIPNFIKGAKYIAPFITFTYKALPRIGEALINNPMKIYKYKAFFDAIGSASRKMNGMSTEEYARQKKVLPPWMLKDIGGIPTNLLMPWTDDLGRTQWLNLEYILPIGQAPEIAQRGLKGLVSNPLINIVSDLTKNVDFKGDPIIPVGSTRAEAIAISTNHIYRQLVPSLTPGLKGVKGWEGGYSFAKIMNAMDKTPDYMERVRSVPITLLDSLVGIKIFPLDVDEAEMFRMYDKKKVIEDLKKQIMKLDHPAINEEYREKRTEELFKRIQGVVDDI